MAVTSLLLKLLLVEKKEQRGLQKKSWLFRSGALISVKSEYYTLLRSEGEMVLRFFENVPFFFFTKIFPWWKGSKVCLYIVLPNCTPEHSGAWVLVFSESENLQQLSSCTYRVIVVISPSLFFVLSNYKMFILEAICLWVSLNQWAMWLNVTVLS